MRTSILLCVAAVVFSCGEERAPTELKKGSCNCIAPDQPWTDEAFLKPHVSEDTYLGSVVSFRWATTIDHGEVLNDWDLSLTSSTVSREELMFRVNLVTDDVSCIEDLGAIPLSQVPEHLSRCDDNVKVVEGHTYLVENRDSDEQQLAVFTVTKLDGVRSATLRWFRSPEADRFTFEH
jgi:hypothetical protein